jgi:SAM-dependent methyltransferase
VPHPAGQPAGRPHGSAGTVLWHDLECGGYGEDLPLWRELAAGAQGAVLDVGAGTGRVTLDLARRGCTVVALDADAVLIAELRRRAEGLPVEAVTADAREFSLPGRRFALAICPMQTVQLLGGPAGRARFLACAREHLAAGGVLAMALADALESFDEAHTEPPPPDVVEHAGTVYASRPVAVRDEGEHVAIERIRETVDPAGHRTAEGDVVRLDRLDAPTLEAEGCAAGFAVLRRRAVAQTDEYVGSQVVVLEARDA